MPDLTALRRRLLLACYRYHTATTPVARFYRAGEREALVKEIQRAKGGKG